MWQWNNYVAPSWDLGIFTQLLTQYSQFSAPIVDIKGPGFNLWGDHFHPILILLTPFFWLFPSGLTLLIAQNILLASSIVPVAWYARRRLGPISGTMLGASYALSWGLANAVKVQFHEIAFAVPLLAFGLVAWLTGRRMTAWLLIAALVFVKEDLGLTVAVFGAVAAWREYRDSREAPHSREMPINTQHGSMWLGLIVWGVTWFVLTIFVILPAFNPAGQWDYTDRLEGDPSIASTLIDFITPSEKLVTVMLLVALGAIIALRSPLILLTLPTLVWRFAGNVEHYWGWSWHYSAVLMPIVVLAAIDAIDRLRRTTRVPRPTQQRWIFLGTGISLTFSIIMIFEGPIQHVVQEHYVLDSAGSRAALESIPAGSVVVSDVRHLAYLAPHHDLYWSGNSGDVVPDYWIAGDQDSPQAMLDRARERWGGEWDVHEYGQIVVVENRADIAPR